jgi:hypothetical protein
VNSINGLMLCRSLNIHSVWGPVVNPFERNGPPRSAGGSSGGSAAAVAASLVDVFVVSILLLSVLTRDIQAQCTRNRHWWFNAFTSFILRNCRVQTFLWNVKSVRNSRLLHIYILLMCTFIDGA